MGGVACSQGGCLLPGRVPAHRGVLVPGGACSGGACSGGVGVLAPGGVPGGDPPNGYCCGRYVSYWNTFLLIIKTKILMVPFAWYTY